MSAGITLRIRIALDGKILLGPGRADLLAQIHATGSIAAAGRGMGMSYKRAWVLVEAMNAAFAGPLVVASKGGAGGGGAALTPLGAAMLAAYRELGVAAENSGAQFLRTVSDAILSGAIEGSAGGGNGVGSGQC